MHAWRVVIAKHQASENYRFSKRLTLSERSTFELGLKAYICGEYAKFRSREYVLPPMLKVLVVMVCTYGPIF